MTTDAGAADPAHVHIDDLPSQLGKVYGPSPWRLIHQHEIDLFADATDDHQWYHVDVDRAHEQLPDGKTIAHGLLTLALSPALMKQVLVVTFSNRSLNYGYDRVRFPAPVQAGDRIRLYATPTEVTEQPKGTLVRIQVKVEIERQTQTAMVADQLLFVLPAESTS